MIDLIYVTIAFILVFIIPVIFSVWVIYKTWNNNDG